MPNEVSAHLRSKATTEAVQPAALYTVLRKGDSPAPTPRTASEPPAKPSTEEALVPRGAIEVQTAGSPKAKRPDSPKNLWRIRPLLQWAQ
jgi:hypothetical protein